MSLYWCCFNLHQYYLILLFQHSKKFERVRKKLYLDNCLEYWSTKHKRRHTHIFKLINNVEYVVYASYSRIFVIESSLMAVKFSDISEFSSKFFVLGDHIKVHFPAHQFIPDNPAICRYFRALQTLWNPGLCGHHRNFIAENFHSQSLLQQN
jgi:hypothetical protein